MNLSKKTILLIIFIVGLVLIFVSVSRKDIKNSLSTSQNQNESVPDTNSSSFIEGLRQREYIGGEIKIEGTLSSNNSYTKYLISYPSDNLKIYGVMNLPKGSGPFPVVILNHGYFNTSTFKSGDGTDTMANILAAKGYITLAPDYRGFGNSEDSQESASRGHRPDYAIDVLNLIASVKSLDKADPNRIGIWGHSMGGEVSLRTIEATDKVKAVVLWAPTSGNAADNAAFYGRGRRTSSPTPNPDASGTSPINYLQYINAPISLHQGLSDTEVNPQWSKNLSDALEKEGKEVEYFEYPGQDHNFKNLGWDEISQRTLEFFDSYLK